MKLLISSSRLAESTKPLATRAGSIAEMGSTFDSAILKKSFEISYALVRIADTIQPDPFARHFKHLGLEVLSATALGSGKKALAALRGIEYLVRLAASTGVITSRNGEVVAEEVNLLVAHMNAALGAPSGDDFDVSSVFSPAGGDDAPIPVRGEVQPVMSHSDVGGPSDGLEAVQEMDTAPEVVSEPVSTVTGKKDAHTETSIRAQIRQSAIFDRIRQSGNPPDGETGCRMTDIRKFFPDVSERTLRYDIEELISQGLVERVGHSGPATSYRAREISIA